MICILDWLEFGPRFLQTAQQRSAPSYGQRVPVSQESSDNSASFWENVCASFHPSLRWSVTIPLWAMFFGLNYASYTNFMWVKEYYDHKQMDSQIDTLYATMALARVAGVLAATVLVASVQNKRALLSFAFLMAGVSTQIAAYHDEYATAAFTMGALFEEVAWASIYVYSGEVYPSIIRNTATGLAMGVSRVGGVLGCLLGRVLMGITLETPFYTASSCFVVTCLITLTLQKDVSRQQLEDRL